MRRRARFVIVMTWIAAGGGLAAQAPDAWRHWQYAAPIEVAAVSAPRLVAVAVTEAVTARATPGWPDLRVIDEAGREVPFILDVRAAADHWEWREGRLLDPSVAPGRFSQAVVDLGPDLVVHNAAVLTFGGTRDFQTTAEVAVGDDGREWRTIAPAVPIFRLKDAGRGERTDVGYPDSRSRYLRLRVAGDGQPIPLERIRVALHERRAAERTPVGVPLQLEAGSRPSESVWTTAAVSRAPIAEVRFETAASQVSRQVIVEAADDRDRWRMVGSGVIARTADVPDRVLAVEFPERTGHSWRVTVVNGNDPPVADLQPALYVTSRRVVFRQEPGHSYRLLYGNARADAPSYELGRVTSREAIDAAAPALLGAEAVNPAYVDPAPWTERHPAVLWTTLGAAILLLGWLAVRTLRKSGSGRGRE